MPDATGIYSASNDGGATDNNEHIPPSLKRNKGILNPVDRISEILFGLIMTLGVTCTMSVAHTDNAAIRHLLIAAVGCNLSWGIVDAVMYILATLAERGHNRSFLNFLHETRHPEEARKFIADALPPVVASALKTEELEDLRHTLLKVPAKKLSPHVTLDDFKVASVIFLIVFFSTIPVAIPFLFIQNVQVALRISNLVAVVFMFVCGWLLGRYGGYHPLQTGLALVLLGAILIGITIVLGG